MILFRYLRFLSPVLSLVFALFCVLIVINTLIYFQSGPTPMFLLEKGEIRYHPIWLVSFYSHIISACVCLLVGLPLMVPAMLRFKRTHFVLGYIYLNSVLWISAPTGLVIAVAAKGGFLGATGFIVTGIVWWASTWLGFRNIRPPKNKQRDIQAHIRWMVRSYSIALSAVTFRLVQILLFHSGIEDIANYVASIWLSLLISILMSEMCIRCSGLASIHAKQFAKSLAKSTSTKSHSSRQAKVSLLSRSSVRMATISTEKGVI